MPWAKIDDDYPTNGKVMEADNETVLFHLFSIFFCAKNLTDGKLTKGQARTVRNGRGLPPSVVDEALRVGFLETRGDGYYVHDYPQYNPTKEQVEAEKEATRVRVARFRTPEKPSSLDHANEGSTVSNGVTSPVTNGDSNGVSTLSPVPGTPDPVPGPIPEKEEALVHTSAATVVAPIVSLAVTCRELLEECAATTKKGAVIGKAYLVAFGNETPPNYGRLSKLSQDAGGPQDLIKLIFRVAPTFENWGNPHDYLTKAVLNGHGKSNGRVALNANIIHHEKIAPAKKEEVQMTPEQEAYWAEKDAIDRAANRARRSHSVVNPGEVPGR